MPKKYLALVVEDDPDLSAIFASALQSAGFETEIITDGGKALARLVEVVPSLVILDLHLPHLSGANALRQIQADRRLLETRVVICTADAAMADELRNQADLVLLKPVMYSQMRDLAARLVPGVQGQAASAGHVFGLENIPQTPARPTPGEQAPAVSAEEPGQTPSD